MWSRTYGGTGVDFGYSMTKTNDVGFIIVGATNSSGAGNYDVYLVKTDWNGAMQWNKTYGGTGDEFGYSIVQTGDGGYTLAGHSSSFGSGSLDVYLVKTDASGNMMWSRAFGGTGTDYAYSIVSTSDGGYIIAGATNSSGAGRNDVYLIKTDANGNMQWSRTYGGIGDDSARLVIQTADGGYALIGATNSFGAGDYDAWLIKTDSAGNPTT